MNPDLHDAFDPVREPRVKFSAEALALRAQLLKAAAATGPVPQPLKDRNLALLCEDASLAGPREICRAAVDLGARVSLVRPRFDALDSATTASTARMLGRLYDGVICIGLPGELVQA